MHLPVAEKLEQLTMRREQDCVSISLRIENYPRLGCRHRARSNCTEEADHQRIGQPIHHRAGARLHDMAVG